MRTKHRIISHENFTKYTKAPSWMEIDSFIKELGMTMYHFEKFYGIPYNVLTQVKSGKRDLPVAFWHIVYERIKTPYGVGFAVESTIKQAKNRINHCLTKALTPTLKSEFKHDALVRLK